MGKAFYSTLISWISLHTASFTPGGKDEERDWKLGESKFLETSLHFPIFLTMLIHLLSPWTSFTGVGKVAGFDILHIICLTVTKLQLLAQKVSHINNSAQTKLISISVAWGDQGYSYTPWSAHDLLHSYTLIIYPECSFPCREYCL